MKLPSEDMKYVTEKLDAVLTVLVPHVSDDEILALVKERLRKAREDYGDFLSGE
jgi:hypothetical protein